MQPVIPRLQAADHCQMPVRDEIQTPVVATRTVGFGGTSPSQTQTFTYNTAWNASLTPYAWSSKTTSVSATDDVLNLTALTKYTYSYVFGNGAAYDESEIAQQIPVESSIAYYNWGNTTTPVRTVNKTWANQYLLTSEQTVLNDDNNLSSQVTYSYNTNNQLIQKNEYDFGASTATRSTVTNYATFNTTTLNGYIVDKPCQTTIEDGSSNVYAQTNYFYDGGTAVCGTPGTPQVTPVSGLVTGTHDETNYASGSSFPRANLTMKTDVVSGGTSPTTTYAYDETGQVVSMTDPCGNAACSDMTGANHTTTYSYTDSFTDGGPSGQTNAYLTTVTSPPTNGVAHVQKYSYRYSDGQLSASIDQNSQETDYQYNDSLDRLTETQYPPDPENGNQRPTTTYAYNDTAPTPSVTSTELQNTAGQSKTSISTTDGVGHAILTQQEVSSGAYDNVSTVYNGEGEVYTVSNPYLSGGSQLLTTYGYDALGRVTSKVNPDQTSEGSSYLGNKVTFTDENGNSWTRTTDALGRLTNVVEPTGGTTATYTYNPLDDLTAVTQGAESRSFIHDSLSRLLTATNPETGTTTYMYDANSNVQIRTDARGVATTYSYDDLNRLLGKTYSDTTYPATYTYDTSIGPNPTNTIGRLTDEKTTVQTVTMTERAVDQYDPMGRILSERQCFVGGCAAAAYTLTHQYDLAGELVGSNNGAPGTNAASFGYSYDMAGRLQTVTSSLSSAQQPATLFQAQAYNAIGLTNANYALPTTGGTPAFSQTLTYDARTRLNGETDTATNPTSNMPYSYSVTYDGDSNVVNLTDSEMGTWTYTPDALNRLITATASAGTYMGLTLTESYDPYGNRKSQIPSGSYSGPVPQPTPVTFTSVQPLNCPQSGKPNNTVDQWQYDCAGNVVNDTLNMYEYDAEGRQTGVLNSVTGLTGYIYDAEGRRVEKVQVNGWNTPTPTTTVENEYLLGLGGEQVTVLGQNSAWAWTNVYAGGKQLATYNGANTYFALTDWLGTKREELSITAPSTVTVAEQCLSLPYGDGLNCTGTDANQLHFTGKERDTESTNDYFGARYYASNIAGRWLTPDWSSKVEPVPYAKLDDPQSLNLYAYVGNNPLSDADADGHSCLVCEMMGHDAPWIGDLLRVAFLKNQKQAQKDESAKSTLQNDQKQGQQNSNNTETAQNQTPKPPAQTQQSPEPDPVVTAAADAAGLVATATKNTPLGVASAIVSVKNDPSTQNKIFTGIGLAPGFEWGVGIMGALTNFMDWSINNSSPGPKKVGDPTTSQQLQPELPTQPSDCQMFGVDGCD